MGLQPPSARHLRPAVGWPRLVRILSESSRFDAGETDGPFDMRHFGALPLLRGLEEEIDNSASRDLLWHDARRKLGSPETSAAPPRPVEQSPALRPRQRTGP